MSPISLHEPLFATYAIAACLVILKAVAMSWLTVYRMMTGYTRQQMEVVIDNYFIYWYAAYKYHLRFRHAQ